MSHHYLITMISLDSEINIDIGGFFRWWGTELYSVLPKSIKKVFDESNSLLVLLPAEEFVSAVLYSGGECLELGELQYNEIGKTALQAMQQEQQAIANADVVIRLPEDSVMLNQVYFPAAAQSNLKQVIGYELDRYTPFTAEQVYYDYFVVGHDKINNQVLVQLVLSRKDKFDQIVNKVQDWGLRLVAVDCSQLPAVKAGVKHKYNLLDEQKRTKKDKWPKVCLALSVLFFVAVLGAAIITPMWAKIKTIEALRDVATQTELEARQVDDLKDSIDTMHVESRAIIDIKNNEPLLMEVFETLSKSINDDTWLLNFKYNEKKLNLQGQSPAASILIGALEKSPLFSNTRFVSPVTQDKRTGLERFQIATDIVVGARHD